MPRWHVFVAALLSSKIIASGFDDSSWGATFAAQLHSYNDLRSLPAALSKLPPGAPRYLKLDPQYLPAALCAGQARAPADPRGCFVLNHDTVGPASRATMNTTEDLLSWLALPSSAVFTADPAAPLTISLCFKGCGGAGCPCDGAPSSAAWLGLVTELLANLSAVVAVRGLHARFLLDGDGNPGAHACLANAWRPLRSVFISGDDPAGAFSRDDAGAGWDRLAVLNEPLSAWPLAAALRFGKFANRSEPMIVWEPSDQSGVLSVAATYAAGAPAPHAGGMLWAINMDPALWWTHVAPALGGRRASNAVLAQGRAPLLRACGGAALALWSDAGGAPRFAALRANGSAWAPLAGGGGGSGGAPLPPLPPPLLPVVPPRSLSLFPLAGGGGALAAVVDGSGGGAAYALSPENGTLTPLRALPLPAPLAALLSRAPAFAAARAAGCGGGGGGGDSLSASCAVVVAALAAGDAAGCLVAAWLLVGGGAAPGAPRACLVAPNANFSSADIDALSVDVAAGPPLAVAAAVSAKGRVWGATACLIQAGGSGGGGGAQLAVNDPAACWGPPPAGLPPAAAWPFPPGTTEPLPFSVGAEGVSVALAPAPPPPAAQPSPLLLLAAGRSHCGNSEAGNKRADVAMCEAPPPPAAGTPAGGQYLAYAAGTLQGWALQLLGAEARDGLWWGTRGGAGPCSTLTHSGAFGMGARPAVGAAPLPGGGGLAALALVQAPQGAPGKLAADPAGCGAALVPAGASGALVLLAWPAPLLLPQ
jgi:hypothetical protein